MLHLEHLNPKQQEAVTHSEGPLMIIAGAGTGKTRVITHRIANLISQGVLPEKILAVTFTNKAAGEMRERVAELLSQHLVTSYQSPVTSSQPLVATFHSLGARILREHAAAAGRTQRFSIFDRDDSISVIKRILKDRGIDLKSFPPGMLLSKISRHKGEGRMRERFLEETESDYFTETLADVWEWYERELERENAFDFDDLVLRAYLAITGNSALTEHYQKRWSHIHVDEYQDTNVSQYLLMRLLAGAHRNLCVVGDHDQCVYTWRSADFRNLGRFEEDFRGADIITLEENYRSTQNILLAANEIIKQNEFRKEKNLFTKGEEGAPLELYTAHDEADEARFVAGQCKKCIAEGTPPAEIAVLFRANFQSRALEEAFLGANIPYQVVGTRFFERKEVKDILSYIHAAFNPESSTHLSRIINSPPRGIGKATLLKMLAKQEHALPAATARKVAEFKNLLSRIREFALASKPSALIKFILKESGLEQELSNEGDDGLERLQNIKELASLAARFDDLGEGDDPLAAFLENAALQSDQDAIRENELSVKLMTIHAAKGLEFERVFIVGLEDGLFPSERSEMRETPEEREEERRLFYVALTRAKQSVILSWCRSRTLFGSSVMNLPSRFLDDIPSELITDINPAASRGMPHSGRGLLDIDLL